MADQPYTVGDLIDHLSNYHRSTEVCVEATPSNVAYGMVMQVVAPCGTDDRAQAAVMLVAHLDFEDPSLSGRNAELPDQGPATRPDRAGQQNKQASAEQVTGERPDDRDDDEQKSDHPE